MNEKETYSYITFPSGLRMVYLREQSMVEYCGLAVNAGSRDETPTEFGLAHFVEHTIFKGTKRRKAWHIINRMEAVGGELNAYTTKEETMVYSMFPAGNLARAAELIFDLAANSQFPDSELDKEREVVADEINSYLDTPSEAVFDDFEDMIFAGSPLGHNILGSVDTVATLTSADCCRYLHRYYTPANMVFFYSGPSSLAVVERLVGRLSSMLPADNGGRRPRETPPAVGQFATSSDVGSHQSHTVIGTRLPGMYDVDRQALALLTNILGGPGMNSLLNVSLRERRGLVYSVDASTAMFTDTGLFTIYFGCDPDDSSRCVRLALREVGRLAESPMSQQALTRAKKQFLGQLTVGSENREQSILGVARATLYYGKALTPAQVRDRMMQVSSDRLLSLAQTIAAAPSILTLR